MKNSRSLTGLSQALAALKHRNFRLFWTGQWISLTGTWMQNVAQAWLVLEITRSAFWLGVVSAVQFTPMLVFSLYAGTLIDRFPKKELLIFTQVSMMTLAFILAADTLLHTVALWHVIILAGLLGIMNTLDMPTRQAFMIELVGKEDLTNAIVLNSAIFNAARVIGPAVAGLVIAKLGIGLCFLLNGASFIPVVGGIAMIRLTERKIMPKPTVQEGVWKEIRTGLSFVTNTPGILVPMTLLAVISVFAVNFNILVPLYAKNIFHRDAQGFGVLMSANGVGALIGSVVMASRSVHGPSTRILITAAAAMCVFELMIVPVKIYGLAFLLLSLIGVSMISFMTTVNSLIQMQTPDHLRGRVMSIYSLLFAGMSPIGSFLSGSAAHAWGAPFTFGLGAVIGLFFITVITFRYRSLLKITN